MVHIWWTAPSSICHMEEIGERLPGDFQLDWPCWGNWSCDSQPYTQNWKKKKNNRTHLYSPLRVKFRFFHQLPKPCNLGNSMLTGYTSSSSMETIILHQLSFLTVEIWRKFFWASLSAKWVIFPWQLTNILLMFLREFIVCWWKWADISWDWDWSAFVIILMTAVKEYWGPKRWVLINEWADSILEVVLWPKWGTDFDQAFDYFSATGSQFFVM
jgi:hypothetical protein